MSLTLTSPAFRDGGDMPVRHTCQGADVSPPLAWSGVPAGAKSLALIVDDPDAPDAKGLPEGAAGAALPHGALQGTNDFQHARYNGPCPPVGRNRYFLKLYALDTMLPDLGKPNKAALENAMRGHVVAHAELIGTYQKSR